MTIRLFLAGYQQGGNDLGVVGFLKDSGGTWTATYTTTCQPAVGDSPQDVAARAQAAMLAYFLANGIPTPDSVVWILDPAALGLSFSNPSRSLNSAFQISTTRNTHVSYAVDISCALSLTTGQAGTVFLEYADDSGFTTNVVEVTRNVNAQTGTLTIGLALTQAVTGCLSGVIPAGKYVRLRTQNNTGTPTFTFRTAQEVLI